MLTRRGSTHEPSRATNTDKSTLTDDLVSSADKQTTTTTTTTTTTNTGGRAAVRAGMKPRLNLLYQHLCNLQELRQVELNAQTLLLRFVVDFRPNMSYNKLYLYNILTRVDFGEWILARPSADLELYCLLWI